MYKVLQIIYIIGCFNGLQLENKNHKAFNDISACFYYFIIRKFLFFILLAISVIIDDIDIKGYMGDGYSFDTE